MNLTSIIMKGLAPAAHSFERALKDPMAAQERVLAKYLARNRQTEYGERHKFSSIRTIADYRARVPLVDYEAIRPLVDRMKKGEERVLTHDKVIFFGLTSGTTGTPKLIPVTRFSQARKASLMDLWAYYVCRDHPRVLDGRILGIISPEVKNHTGAGIPYGPEDGHAYNNLPEIIKRLYVLPYELFSIGNYDARYYAILRIAMEQNITTIATLNPSTLVLLTQRIPLWQDVIIADIAAGTLDRSFDIPVAIRRTIERRLRPNAQRARELKALIKEWGALLPKYFWPELDLIECWKGGAASFYLEKLPPAFGAVAVRDFGCLSTEARSSVPMSDTGASGVLAVQANFYEFIPREDIGKPRARTLLCTELEVGKEYLLIVTTPGGLYRYDIDDIVRVDGFFGRTPVIEFVQKGRNAISITGEKVYESQVAAALSRALTRGAMVPRSFCATVAAERPSRYVFLIECDGTPSAADKRRLLMLLEEELRKENSEYDDSRKQQILTAPSLKILRSGEFERYRQERVCQGAHDTQFKMPKVVADPAFQSRFAVLEEIRMPDQK